MTFFLLGATVICSTEIYDSGGNLFDPDTTTITISYWQKGVPIPIISDADMTYDSQGKYHYDFDTAGQQKGRFTIRYSAIFNSRISLEEDVFELK